MQRLKKRILTPLALHEFRLPLWYEICILLGYYAYLTPLALQQTIYSVIYYCMNTAVFHEVM